MSEHHVTSRADGYGNRDCSCGGVWNDGDETCSSLKAKTEQPVELWVGELLDDVNVTLCCALESVFDQTKALQNLKQRVVEGIQRLARSPKRESAQPVECTYREWFQIEPYRRKYMLPDNNHPVYMLGQEAWDAALKLAAHTKRESGLDKKKLINELQPYYSLSENVYKLTAGHLLEAITDIEGDQS